MATYTINLKQLRPKLAKVVKEADELYSRYLITRHGKVKAVIMSSDELESLTETIEILADNKLLRELNAAQKELAGGKGKALKKLKKELNV